MSVLSRVIAMTILFHSPILGCNNITTHQMMVAHGQSLTQNRERGGVEDMEREKDTVDVTLL
jgi:hypothetical protein